MENSFRIVPPHQDCRQMTAIVRRRSAAPRTSERGRAVNLQQGISSSRGAPMIDCEPSGGVGPGANWSLSYRRSQPRGQLLSTNPILLPCAGCALQLHRSCGAHQCRNSTSGRLVCRRRRSSPQRTTCWLSTGSDSEERKRPHPRTHRSGHRRSCETHHGLRQFLLPGSWQGGRRRRPESPRRREAP
jgi:hypothetical protein